MMKPTRVFLFVPLALASLTFSATSPQQGSSSLGWKQTERTDAVRGKYTRFTLVGKFVKSPQGEFLFKTVITKCEVPIEGFTMIGAKIRTFFILGLESGSFMRWL
jgi:hypothetical protein